MDPKSNDPRYNFYANPTIDEIFLQQGKGPIHVAELRKNAWPNGEAWPDDEFEEFLIALREWRGHGKTDPAA